MTRAVFALIVIALAVVALMVPALDSPQPGVAAAVDLPSVSVCPVDEGSGRNTSVGVVSTAPGSGQLTAFVGGQSVGSTPFVVDSGAVSLPVAEVAAVGVATGLVELPEGESAGAAVITGGESTALEVCSSFPEPQALLGGGSTSGDSEFDIQLMNPYSGEARVDLTVRSESGLESASQLRGLAVPSRSTVVVDMDEVLPGRETLAVTLETTSGSTTASGRLLSGNDIALWNAVSPAQDWFVPVPSGGVGQVIITTGVGDDVEYQIDLYGPEGLVEAFDEGVVPAYGSVGVDVGVAGSGAAAFRVVSTQPVAVFLRHSGEDGLALTTGSKTAAARWLLPGAGLAAGGAGRMVILNAGLETTSATITAHGEDNVVKAPPVGPGAVLEFAAISQNAYGYTVTSEGLLVPLWVTSAGTSTAYATGVPLVDE